MHLHAHKIRVTAATIAAAVAFTACRSYPNGPPEVARAVASTTTTAVTTTTTTSTTTTTTRAPVATVAPTATAPPAPLPGLGRGATGAQVGAVEKRLAELRYDVGNVDGVFDGATHHAVMAFQKAHNLPRTGRATDDVLAALPTATLQGALLPDGGPDRVEIDLKRQVLLLWQGGSLVRTLSISTGTGKRYCVDGQCAKAVTPGGSYRIGRKIKGLRVSRLGKLYNPLYFNGGIAIHGSPSVPAGPASHGCVRIPMVSSVWFHETVSSGTPVYVIGGARAPVPFNEPEPTDGAPAPTAPATAPTTTAPTTTSTTTTTLAPLPTETTTTTTTTTTTPSSPLP